MVTAKSSPSAPVWRASRTSTRSSARTTPTGRSRCSAWRRNRSPMPPNTPRRRRSSCRSSEDKGVRLRVADNGIGVPENAMDQPKAHGLLGMRERISMLGGTFAIGRDPAGRHGGRRIRAVRLSRAGSALPAPRSRLLRLSRSEFCPARRDRRLCRGHRFGDQVGVAFRNRGRRRPVASVPTQVGGVAHRLPAGISQVRARRLCVQPARGRQQGRGRTCPEAPLSVIAFIDHPRLRQGMKRAVYRLPVVSCPTTPPTAAPPTVPSMLPLRTLPRTAPPAAPMAVFCPGFHAGTRTEAPGEDQDCDGFLSFRFMIFPLQSWGIALSPIQVARCMPSGESVKSGYHSCGGSGVCNLSARECGGAAASGR